MALLQPVLYTILQLIVLAGIGFALKRWRKWPDEFFRRLSKFLVTYALPLYLFTGISHTSTDELKASGLLPLFALALIGLGLGLSFLLFTVFRVRGNDRRAGIALSTFGNAAYLPLSVIAIFQLTVPQLADRLGGNRPSLYVGAFLLTFSPLLWTAGNLLLTRGEGGFRLRELITPPFLGVAAGFVSVLTGLAPIMLNTSLPLFPVFRALEMLGNVTFPMILISLGAMIADLHFGRNVHRQMVLMAVLVSLTRFVLFPGIFVLLYFAVFRHTDMSAALMWVLFLEMTAPPATNLSVMAGSARVNEHSTAFTLLLTYVVYMVVLPFELVVFLSLPGVLPSGPA